MTYNLKNAKRLYWGATKQELSRLYDSKTKLLVWEKTRAYTNYIVAQTRVAINSVKITMSDKVTVSLYVDDVHVEDKLTTGLNNEELIFNGINAKAGSILKWVFDDKLTNISLLFMGNTSFNSVDMSNLDGEEIVNLSSAFSGMSNLTSLNLTGFSVPKLKLMVFMVLNCSKLLSLDLTEMNISKITSMNAAFSNCKKLEQLNVGNVHTSLVTDFSSLFNNCSSLTSLDLSSFDFTHYTASIYNPLFTNVTGMVYIKSEYQSTIASNSPANVTWI